MGKGVIDVHMCCYISRYNCSIKSATHQLDYPPTSHVFALLLSSHPPQHTLARSSDATSFHPFILSFVRFSSRPPVWNIKDEDLLIPKQINKGQLT